VRSSFRGALFFIQKLAIMEFKGTVYKILTATSGTSARGPWHRQEVVFDYNDGGQFSRKIVATFFNKESDVAKLHEGDVVNVSVNIDSHEYNGRWFNDIRVWRIQAEQVTNPNVSTDTATSAVDTSVGSTPEDIGAPKESDDDLPF
jgi:hypothetical protein